MSQAEKTAEEIAAEQAAQAATQEVADAKAKQEADAKKLADDLAVANAKAEAAEKTAAEAKAELAFANLTKKTPAAEDHKADILAKAQASNLSLEEATVLVLASKGVSTTAAPSGSLGGGAAQTITLPTVDSSKMTQDQRLAEIKKLSPEELTAAFKSINTGT